MGNMGAWAGGANGAGAPGGVQTVSANKAQSLQAPVNNTLPADASGQTCATA